MVARMCTAKRQAWQETIGDKIMSPLLARDGLKARIKAINLPMRFFILTALVLFFGMSLLGARMVTQATNDILKAQTMTGRTFINLYLAPHVQSTAPITNVSPAVKQQLDALMKGSPLEGRVLSVKIWTLQGKIVYNSLGDLNDEELEEDVIRKIWNGEVIVEYNQLGEHHATIEKKTNLPLFEVYAPIYRQGTNQVIAIGEYYENVSWLITPLHEARLYTWMYIGAITLVMLGLMSVLIRKAHQTITRQSIELRNKITTANDLAEENDELRLQADDARLNANEANEQLLARIGADLHDGPIQLVSLLILKLSAGGSATNTAAETAGTNGKLLAITQSALEELRTISAGLSLPEIENLSLQEAIELAIYRHEDLTGLYVVRDFGLIPDVATLAFKICVYRVIQESLTNAQKHAAGAKTTVAIGEKSGVLHISVKDDGPGVPLLMNRSRTKSSMGLSGIRNRIDVFKGSFRIESVKGKGTCVIVELPLTAAEEPKKGANRKKRPRQKVAVHA